ncbi:MAG: hydrogenase subunit MbhD domain-containing protein [Gemmatimonadota bacterium]
MTAGLLFDIALVVGLTIIAFRAIHAPDLFVGAVLYIVFGLLLALVWVRLNAPDLALAEAAIGAGITGAMLLDAVRQVGSPARRAPVLTRIGRVAPWAGAVGLGAVAAGALVTLEDRGGTLGEMVRGRVAESGVDHPVTAVLLVFRGYDTWLEVGVLLVAAIAVLGVRRTRVLVPSEPSSEAPPIATAAAGVLLPAGVLIGGFLLWTGSHAPGGAFQAAAVLAAMGILVSLLGRPPLASLSALRLRLLLVCGFTTFLAAGVVGLLVEDAFLRYPAAAAGWIITVIELAVTVSIAASLVLLFAGGRDRAADEAAG